MRMIRLGPPQIPRRDPAELPHAKRCRVCLQLEDQERAEATLQLVVLVGHATWAVCPACAQEAPDGRDPSYRRRAKKYLDLWDGRNRTQHL